MIHTSKQKPDDILLGIWFSRGDLQKLFEKFSTPNVMEKRHLDTVKKRIVKLLNGLLNLEET